MPLSIQDLKDLIVNDATRLGNDPALMLALADHESRGFNPNALSPTGVRGLFQVTNQTGGPYGQTPQTRSDPTVSSDVGQRHFKDLLYKAGGDVPTALTWYNGGSDPKFAQRVLAKVAGHQARLGKAGSTDAILNDVYGPAGAPTPAAPAAAAAPSTDAILNDVYGPATTPTPATPAAGTAPLPMMAPDAPLPPSQLTLDIAKPSAPGPTPPGRTPLEGNTLDDRADTTTGATIRPWADAGVDTAKAVGAMGLVTGGTMGGAALGAMTGPFAPVAVPAFSAAGAELGNMASKYLGWQPGKWNEPDLSDALAVGVPLVAGTARAALPYTRAGRAVQTATDATTAEEAQHARWLAEAEAAHKETVAQAQAARKPWQSTWGVTDPPVPPELARLRANPPTPVEPTLPPPTLSSLAKHYFGYVPSWFAPVAAPVDIADTVISHALNSPTLRPWLQRQLAASGGTLTPQTLAMLNAMVRGGMQDTQRPVP